MSSDILQGRAHDNTTPDIPDRYFRAQAGRVRGSTVLLSLSCNGAIVTCLSGSVQIPSRASGSERGGLLVCVAALPKALQNSTATRRFAFKDAKEERTSESAQNCREVRRSRVQGQKAVTGGAWWKRVYRTAPAADIFSS